MLPAILTLLSVLLLIALVALAAKIHGALSRLATFLDAQDIDRRRSHVEAQRAREVRHKAVESFFKDTRGILGKLHTMIEELSPYQRETLEIRPMPAAPTSSESRPRALPPSPHQRAAGLGARPVGEHRLRRPEGPLPAPLPPPRRPADTRPSMPAVGAPTSRPTPRIAAHSKCPDCERGVAIVEGRGYTRCETCGGRGELVLEESAPAREPEPAGP